MNTDSLRHRLLILALLILCTRAWGQQRVERIEIRWPSGISQTAGPVASDQRLRIVESERSG